MLHTQRTLLCGEHGESFDDPSLHRDPESGTLLSLLDIREEAAEPHSSISRPSSLIPSEEASSSNSHASLPKYN